MHIEENRPLAPFTTFGIGGPARWFVEAKSEDEVVEAVRWGRGQEMRLFVLGGGSNLLVSDWGWDGLVLRIALRGVTASDAPDDWGRRIYSCAAGENWDEFVEHAASDDCAGIECLAGIPGTVGGTPVQNVGAYGQEVASTVVRVRAFDLTRHEFVELAAAECGFAYRRSRFNSSDRGRFIVTRVDYRLTAGGAPTLRYADLEKAFANRPSDAGPPRLTEVTAAVRRIRQAKGMLIVAGDPDCRSAGSFFKNPVVTEEHAARIEAAVGCAVPRFPAGTGAASAGHVKLPAAWLIEQAGFSKGYVRGPAGISSRHTLALVNRGGATAMDILDIASEIHVAVEKRFGISLETEPDFVGRLA